MSLKGSIEPRRTIQQQNASLATALGSANTAFGQEQYAMTKLNSNTKTSAAIDTNSTPNQDSAQEALAALRAYKSQAAAVPMSLEDFKAAQGINPAATVTVAKAVSVPTQPVRRDAGWSVMDAPKLNGILNFSAKVDPLNLTSSETVSLGQALAIEKDVDAIKEFDGAGSLIIRVRSHFTTSNRTIEGFYNVRVSLRANKRFVVEEEVLHHSGQTFWQAHPIMGSDKRRDQQGMALRPFNLGGREMLGVVNYNPVNISHEEIFEMLVREGGVLVNVENRQVIFLPQGLTQGVQEALILNAQNTALYKSVQGWNKYTLMLAMRLGMVFSTHRTIEEVIELLEKGRNSELRQDQKQVEQAQRAQQYAARQSQPASQPAQSRNATGKRPTKRTFRF